MFLYIWKIIELVRLEYLLNVKKVLSVVYENGIRGEYEIIDVYKI